MCQLNYLYHETISSSFDLCRIYFFHGLCTGCKEEKGIRDFLCRRHGLCKLRQEDREEYRL